jgi:hypothetical protein
MRRHSESSCARKCATPLVELCVCAPPSASLVHVFVRDGLDHVGPGDEHVAGSVHHKNEIGERGRVHRTAGAGPMMADICGTTPLEIVLRRKMSA